jgi:ribosomal protein L11 methyltransferase
LLDLGSSGVETEELTHQTRVSVYFRGPAPIEKLERLCEQLPELFPGTSLPVITAANEDEELWVENWKQHFPPLVIGSSLFVHPPWVEQVPPGRIGIVIDPGMAFGTGHHPSTRGCLLLLEETCTARTGRRVLDVGTGSGILAIAAVKLGAGEVLAVDIDPTAREVARRNCEVNAVSERVRICASLDDTDGRFDIVLANLFAEELARLADRIAEVLSAGGTAVGAGILVEEERAVSGAWRAAGLVPHARLEEEGWVALGFRGVS